MLMLSTILSYPLFTYETYWSTTTYYEGSIQLLSHAYVEYGQSSSTREF